jgi:hypothetical protein
MGGSIVAMAGANHAGAMSVHSQPRTGRKTVTHLLQKGHETLVMLHMLVRLGVEDVLRTDSPTAVSTLA